jgi:hypothetical protein
MTKCVSTSVQRTSADVTPELGTGVAAESARTNTHATAVATGGDGRRVVADRETLADVSWSRYQVVGFVGV